MIEGYSARYIKIKKRRRFLPRVFWQLNSTVIDCSKKRKKKFFTLNEVYKNFDRDVDDDLKKGNEVIHPDYGLNPNKYKTHNNPINRILSMESINSISRSFDRKKFLT